MNPAAVPSPFDDKRSDDRWMSIHKRFLMEAREQEPEVLFIGDYLVSLASQTEIWQKLFVPMHCLNFGISEDQTQHVLWRIENGEIDTTNPKVIVLSVGANNVDHSVEQIVGGIEACVKAILERKPNATLVVLKLMPCGQHPNPMRSKILEVNQSLQKVLNKKSSGAQLVDINPGFVLPDGSISHHDMYDYLHLTQLAYTKAFDVLADLLQQLLSESSSETPVYNM